MFEVRIHGRGGQGVVTAAELLSVAAFGAGRYAQAFPSFGSERTGAPVVAFCRIAAHPIRLREPVERPDGLIVQDPTLLRQIDVFAGLKPHGYVLFNSRKDRAGLGLDAYADRLDPGRVVIVPATQLGEEHVGRPVPNAALLGAFAALTGVTSLEAVAEAIRDRFPGAVGAGNVTAATVAYELVRRQVPEDAAVGPDGAGPEGVERWELTDAQPA
jgi:pyruvate ferredoxin oxidoreductase gamma subunit